MKRGFTLAEVLITLAIIGVVAALTIPTVVINYQKQETVTRLKKTFSAIANTTNLAIADEGPVEGWDVENYTESNASLNFTNKYLAPYLKVLENCGSKTTDMCQMDFKYLNGDLSGHLVYNSYAVLILNDGTCIGTATYNIETLKGAQILVDINCAKKPNTFGKDIFDFHYYVDYEGKKGKFMPRCYDYTREELLQECNKNNIGKCCSALIIKDGWKISEDYPWN